MRAQLPRKLFLTEISPASTNDQLSYQFSVAFVLAALRQIGSFVRLHEATALLWLSHKKRVTCADVRSALLDGGGGSHPDQTPAAGGPLDDTSGLLVHSREPPVGL